MQYPISGFHPRYGSIVDLYPSIRTGQYEAGIENLIEEKHLTHRSMGYCSRAYYFDIPSTH